MTEHFYKDVIREAGIDVLTPEGEVTQTVNSILFDELCVGIIREQSKQLLLNVIRKLQENGAQGVILGCTELGLLIHAREAALAALR